MKNKFLPSQENQSKYLAETLKPQGDVSKITEAFLVRTIVDVLKRPEVAKEGVGFTKEVLEDPVMYQALVGFLVAGAKEPIFQEELKKLGLVLVQDILKDPEVQRDLTKLLIVKLVY